MASCPDRDWFTGWGTPVGVDVGLLGKIPAAQCINSLSCSPACLNAAAFRLSLRAELGMRLSPQAFPGHCPMHRMLCTLRCHSFTLTSLVCLPPRRTTSGTTDDSELALELQDFDKLRSGQEPSARPGWAWRPPVYRLSDGGRSPCLSTAGTCCPCLHDPD